MQLFSETNYKLGLIGTNFTSDGKHKYKCTQPNLANRYDQPLNFTTERGTALTACTWWLKMSVLYSTPRYRTGKPQLVQRLSLACKYKSAFKTTPPRPCIQPSFQSYWQKVKHVTMFNIWYMRIKSSNLVVITSMLSPSPLFAVCVSAMVWYSICWPGRSGLYRLAGRWQTYWRVGAMPSSARKHLPCRPTNTTAL